MERGNWLVGMMIRGLFIGIMLRFILCMSFMPLVVEAYDRFVVDGAESELGILDLIQVCLF
jgi:hypothetical protein